MRKMVTHHARPHTKYQTHRHKTSMFWINPHVEKIVMSLRLPDGRKIPDRPCLLLQSFMSSWPPGAVPQLFCWLYENGQCVGYDIGIYDGECRQTYDTHGTLIQDKARRFAHKTIKHYCIWYTPYYNGWSYGHWACVYKPFTCEPALYAEYHSGFELHFFCNGIRTYGVCNTNTQERYSIVSGRWKFAMLRFKHVLRLRARRRVASIVSASTNVTRDMAMLIAAFVV